MDTELILRIVIGVFVVSGIAETLFELFGGGRNY